MISVQEAVQEIVKVSPFMQEALSRGIINLSAFARKIHPDVEAIVKKEIILPIFRAFFRESFQNVSLNPNINKIIIDTAVDLFFERALYWCNMGDSPLTLKELFT